MGELDRSTYRVFCVSLSGSLLFGLLRMRWLVTLCSGIDSGRKGPGVEDCTLEMSCSGVLLVKHDCERCRLGPGVEDSCSDCSDIALFDRLKNDVMAPWPVARGLVGFARTTLASALLLCVP